MASAELVIEGVPRPKIRQALRELRSYRGTILAFAERDVRVKYKQTVLGIAWAVIQPLVFMAIFTLTLGRLAKVPGGGAPYAAFALSVLVPWTFLQTSVQFGANALLADAALVRKVYFPREVPILGSILATAVDVVIGLTLFAVIGPFLGAVPSGTWLLAPLLLVALASLASGVALIVAALNVHYRDFRYALPFLLQFWLFVSPVAYPLSIVPPRWRMLFVGINPAAGILDGFRVILTLGRLPDAKIIGLSLFGCLVVAGVGYRVFKRLEPNFAEVI